MSFKTLNELIKEHGLLDVEFVNTDGDVMQWNNAVAEFRYSCGMSAVPDVNNPVWRVAEKENFIEGWMNVYEKYVSAPFATRRDADSVADKTRIACVKVKIPYKRGQFDE